IEIKADININPGTEWEREIARHLNEADIILLLISSDFIASDYCYEKEMYRAIERHKQGTARVVPVIIRPTAWENMPFSRLQSLPKDAKPIAMRPDKDEAWKDVAEGIRKVIDELLASSPRPAGPRHRISRRTAIIGFGVLVAVSARSRRNCASTDAYCTCCCLKRQHNRGSSLLR